MYRRFLLILTLIVNIIAFCPNEAWTQGVTTASVNGIVTDSKGAPLEAATVVALHVPSGTQYGSLTRKDGRYNLPGLRVGGPYTILITFVGFKERRRDGLNLSLGQDFTFDVRLEDDQVQLNEVVVGILNNSVINSNRTGAGTNISRDQIQQLPTISRSLGDYTRLVPQSNGQSFGGRNNLYNNFTIDGAVFNNSFGLSSTVGGQANAQPISLDAIDQVQVNIAPYDVRQGSFTGASINAVTRSGTNELSGSAYTFYRNQDLTGFKVKDVKLLKQDLSSSQTGFRLGGPIIKNKLFFFVNGEIERRKDPGTYLVANRPGITPAPGPGSNTADVLASDLDALRDELITRYNYNPGPYENYALLTNSTKATVKLDWNISKNHKFSIKYNFLNSYRDNPPSNSGTFAGGGSASFTSLPFQSSFYRINNNLNSIIAELNSTLSNKFSNNFTVGYTGLRDFRESQVNPTPFPNVQINNFTTFGYEAFSAGNKLNTDIYQISDNFTGYLGAHTITVGTYNELYGFENGFAPNFYGVYRYNDKGSFYNSINGAGTVSAGSPYYTLQYSAKSGDKFPLAKFNALQLGFFAQDEWRALPTLKITAGIRLDVPILLTKLDKNPVVEGLEFRDGQKLDVSKFQKTTPLWSPRVGFNWDVTGEKSTQIRGGTGVFTGRVPYVWISNQAGNNGLLYGQLTTADTKNYPFTSDVNAYIPSNATAAPSFNLAITDPNFKFPQVWRTNIAIDKRLPWGIIGTLEYIYTQDINAVYHKNVNLPTPARNAEPAQEGGDNREVFYPIGGPVKNQLNNQIPSGSSGGAILMTNTKNGYSASFAATLSKSFNNFFFTTSYVYGTSKDVNSGGSIAASVFRDRPVVGDPNNSSLGFSNYNLKHRIIASASYKKEYLKNFATSISFFYEASPAGVFSYTYNGDMNGDNSGGNSDLIWVPRDKDDIILIDKSYKLSTGETIKYTKEQQRDDLDSYINQDKYLKEHRGQYAERNGAQLPFQSKLDFRLLQDFYFKAGGKRNTLQLSVDILNVGNLLNSNWGIAKTTSRSFNSSNRSTALIKYEGYNPAGQPTFSFEPLAVPTVANPAVTPLKNSFNSDFGMTSRYQIQIGLRYIFN